MKMRKFTALLAVLTLICALWAPVAVSAETPAPVTAPAAPAAPAAVADDMLDAPLELLAALDNGDKLCAVYSQIIDGIRKGETYFAFEGGYTLTEQEQAILQSVVDATIPEIYGDYAGHSYCSVYEDFFSGWFYDWGVTAEQFSQLEQVVAEMTADLAGKSDYEKSLILHDRLVKANVYDYSEHHQTAYGALIEGASVCAGYARAYQLLLQSVGIPCLYVSGTADNGSAIGGHAWNIVRLDGQWYYCDTTWDDYDNLYWGVQYPYFNTTYADISVDHFLDPIYEEWVPRSTSTDHNYFVREGLVVETLTLNQMIALLKKHNPAHLKLVGDIENNARAIVNLFYNNFDTIAKELGAPSGNGWVSYSSDYSIFDLVMVLDHQHDYEYQITDPTCEEYGDYIYACRTCGDRDWVSTDPLGHNAADAWSCDENGHYKVCTRCDGAVEYGEHTYAGGACSVCGYGDAVCDHEYAVTVLIEVSCQGYGWYEYTCTLCGDHYNETIPALGHISNGFVPFDGETHVLWCERCNDIVEEYSHTYDDDRDADCNDCGYQRQITLYGDANGDGKINNKDLGRLQQYLNGWEIDIDASACDLNGDGKVNNKDLGRLQQYLNGWDVTLG